MASRIRSALRRLVDDYGSSESEEDSGESQAKSGAVGSLLSGREKRRGSASVSERGTEKSLRLRTTSMSMNGRTKSPPSDSFESLCIEPELLSNGHSKHSHQTREPIQETLDKTETIHGDRVRAFPHETGNWATFVYLIPHCDGLQSLFTSLLDTAAAESNREWWLIGEPHVSLSRTIVLRYHEISSFILSLQTTVKHSHVSRFPYRLDGVSTFVNDNKSTTFLALDISVGSEQLGGVVEAVDKCLSNFKLPKYYENNKFHLSFAWTSGELEESDFAKLTQSVQERFEDLKDDFTHELNQCAKAIYCKCGNRTYLVPMANP